MGTKTKVAAVIGAVLAIAVLWVEKPRLQLLWLLNSEIKTATAEEQKIVSMVKKAAESGDAQSQFNLAVMYEKGFVLAKDQGQALSWYDRAATQGHPEARRVLDAYVKSGLITSPSWRGKWSPLSNTDEGKSAEPSR